MHGNKSRILPENLRFPPVAAKKLIVSKDSPLSKLDGGEFTFPACAVKQQILQAHQYYFRFLAMDLTTSSISMGLEICAFIPVSKDF